MARLDQPEVKDLSSIRNRLRNLEEKFGRKDSSAKTNQAKTNGVDSSNPNRRDLARAKKIRIGKNWEGINPLTDIKVNPLQAIIAGMTVNEERLVPKEIDLSTTLTNSTAESDQSLGDNLYDMDDMFAKAREGKEIKGKPSVGKFTEAVNKEKQMTPEERAKNSMTIF